MSLLTRRAFLERTTMTTAAAAAVGLPRLLAEAQASGMWISLNGAVAPRVGAWPAMAELASQVGYGGIDYSLATSATGPTLRGMGAEAAKKLLADLKLRPTIANSPVNPSMADPAAFETALADLEGTAQFMQAIGATRVMVVMSATVPRGQAFDEYRAAYKDRLSKIAAVLARHNIRIGLEFLGPQCMHLGTCGGNGGNRGGGRGGAAAGAAGATPALPTTAAPAASAPAQSPAPAAPTIPFLYTLPETVKLATEAGPNVGVILDVWHWHHSGGTAADILAVDKSRIVHVHLSDSKAMAPEDVRDSMRLMPGEGIIDYAAFFGALKKIGYTGGVAPEPLGRIPADMSTEDAAKLGYTTTRAVMQKAGVL